MSNEKTPVCYNCGSSELIYKGDVSEGVAEYQCAECKKLQYWKEQQD